MKKIAKSKSQICEELFSNFYPIARGIVSLEEVEKVGKIIEAENKTIGELDYLENDIAVFFCDKSHAERVAGDEAYNKCNYDMASVHYAEQDHITDRLSAIRCAIQSIVFAKKQANR